MSNPFNISIEEVKTNLFSKDIWRYMDNLLDQRISYDDIKMMNDINP